LKLRLSAIKNENTYNDEGYLFFYQTDLAIDLPNAFGDERG